jgi:hypothetical protein
MKAAPKATINVNEIAEKIAKLLQDKTWTE